MSFVSAVLDLFFPPKCVFCRRVVDSGVSWCCKCDEGMPYTTNGGRRKGEFFDFCVSPVYYEDVVRKSLLRYKFDGASQYASAYGEMLAGCIREYVDEEYDIISWVPLSAKRKRSRGYDQAKLLAIATALNLDRDADVEETLVKIRDVKPQSELSGKTLRDDNISGAYDAADPDLVEGRSILLIDDIITTGATLSECARVLLTAGAKNVICATFARGD